MISLLSLLTLLTLAACKTTPTVNTTTTANINAGAPYYWLSYSSPKALKISESFSVDEVQNIVDMSSAWKTSVSNKKTFFDHGTDRIPEISNSVSNLDNLRDQVLGIYKTTTWPANLPGSALAVTQLFGRRYNIGASDEYVNIEHADILVNFDIYTFDTNDTGNGFDLRTVLLHEMGHFIGLTHKGLNSDTNASIMYPSVGPTTVKRVPTVVDAADISAKYNIGVSSQRVEPRPRTGGDEVRIILELHADGECVHRVNGTAFERHSLKLDR
ncbi:MAG TPA: matrixin family metalloprotease [Bacteriovoracaceae bacterium]|nr:matrixin family metalloprotease [Bacteriovoracaceae bacterium]